jgi:hypothetical protein
MSLWEFVMGKPAAQPAPAPKPKARGSVLHVAVLALKYRGHEPLPLTWVWACDADKEYALGYALAEVDKAWTVAGWTVIEIPLASGTEAQSGETGSEADGLDPKDDGPTGEAGDAQTQEPQS